jgi:N-acyl-D-aspartate/D-glutamate deacylase
MAFDLVIKNGMVIDGSGMGRYRADVGVKNGVVTRGSPNRRTK